MAFEAPKASYDSNDGTVMLTCGKDGNYWFLANDIPDVVASLMQAQVEHSGCVAGDEFVPLKKYPGYSVSRRGEIRSDRVSVRGRHGMRSQRARILLPQPSGKKRNYMAVSLSIDGRLYRKKVAHLVAEAFFGERPEGCDVDHIDGDTKNNSVANLRYLDLRINRGRRDV